MGGIVSSNNKRRSNGMCFALVDYNSLERFSTLSTFSDDSNRTVMPRVVPDQREKFENDELFRKMSRESEVSTLGYAIVIDYYYR